MSIGDCTERSNNLSFMKFVAAILVIYAHSYAITGTTERLVKWPGEVVIDWGGLAVAFFFFASGFYVTKSLLTKKDGKKFFAARIGRLYPVLAIIIFTTVFIAGPVLTHYTVREYFLSSNTYKYFFCLLLLPQYRLPGVFENNPLQYTVNGSLWSLTLEAICYIGLYCAYRLKFLEKKKLKCINIFLGIMTVVIFIVRPQKGYQFLAYMRPLFIFIAGMEYYIFRKSIKIDLAKIVVSVLLGGFLFQYDLVDFWMVSIFPYFISAIIFSKRQICEKLSDLGKYSYCIYLTAFPIQQILASCIPQMTVLQNTLSTVFISLMIAIPLYRFIEVPCYKKIMQFAEKSKY